MQQFFRWLDEEEEIPESPMRRMKPPKVPEVPPPVQSEENLTLLLKDCSGGAFNDRRDHAILRIFVDTGGRLGEVAGVSVEDVDLHEGAIRVLGKGNRERFLFIGAKTIQALDRYLRRRATHKHASSESLWLGPKGPMTDSGIAQMVRARAKRAGLSHLHPHVFRHTFAHLWRLNEGPEGELQTIGGWKDRRMLDRYGASAAGVRAKEAHRRLGPGDRL